MKKTMKLKKLVKLLGVELPGKMNFKPDVFNFGYNECKADYDNLEIPIERLKPSIEELERCIDETLIEAIHDNENSIKKVAQAIHNLKPGEQK